MAEQQPDIVTVTGPAQEPLLSIRADGSVDAPTLETASEAGRVFVESIRQYLVEHPLPVPAHGPSKETSEEIAALAARVLNETPREGDEHLSFNALLVQAKRLAGSALAQREPDGTALAGFDDAVHRIGEGTFYDDYDYAAGLGLRVLRAAGKAMRDFVDKVDRGEARSKRSYAAFKAVLDGSAE